MHLTLKKEATRPAGMNFLQQQAKFDKFIDEFNNERPDEALNMKYPCEIYSESPRVYQGLPSLEYPLHDRTVNVSFCARICIEKKKINLSRVFAGHALGIRQVELNIWLLTFIDYDLGYFDTESNIFEPLPNPFGAKVLPMC